VGQLDLCRAERRSIRALNDARAPAVDSSADRIIMTEPNRRILIVDDNRAVHGDFYKILQGRPKPAVTELETELFGRQDDHQVAFELSSAYQGEQAVELARAALAASRPFALAFVDMRMPPGISGLETIGRLWEVDPELQVVICTAYSDASWQDIVKRFGATDRLLILKKPFDVIEVSQLALALTQKWQLAHEARMRMAELSQSRADLAASLALARAVQDATAEGLLVIGSDRKVSTANRRFFEMWRIPPELIEARDDLRMLAFVRDQLADPDAMFERVRYFYDHPDESGNDELTLKDGRVYERFTAPVRSANGQPPDRLWWFRDITERRKLELDRAVVTERMASMGRLAAGVGHEINNPLTYALGNIDSLLEANELPDGMPPITELLQRLRETRDGLMRIRVIVRDLQTLTRSDEAHGEIELRQVVDQAIQIAGAELRNVAPIVRRYESVSTVLGSRTRLGQVFLNLIVNAAQAAPQGASAGHRIEIAIRSVGSEAVVEVIDTGSGIAPEHLERIFDPFFTTKPVGMGTGLGLSISREIIVRHGGTLTARSTPGLGTTMTVRLPHGARVVEPVSPIAAVVSHARRAKVLVIDDEPLIARILQRGLSRHHVVVTEHARDALARIEQGETFDVILCDLMMPEVSGIDVHEYLSREHPAVARRMVFMTGGAFTSRAKSFLSTVGNERIEKPFSIAQVSQLVDRYVGTRRRRGSPSAAYGRGRAP
jgi:signal transduction histidine kinase/ActR/RegA family two-component response regulator